MAVTLINAFKVPLDQEEAFVAGWKKTSAGLIGKPGFLDACLHRNTGKADKEFLYVNVAHWETADELRNSDPKSIWDAKSLPGVKDFPGVFEEVIKLP